MNLFSSVSSMGHEQVVYCYDAITNLKAIIAIHDTTLGSALGGLRVLPYHSESEALDDVLRLSRAMTYKAACAGLQLGGGKSVIIANPKLKSEAMMRSYARFVNSLNGRYIAAEDMNTNIDDMNHIRIETKYVTGVSPDLGGSGEPAPMSALGVYYGIQASVAHRYGRQDLTGLRVSVQGVGAVGRNLCKLLHEKGVKLYVTDINEKNLQEVHANFGATVVSEREFYGLDVDVYSPCARGSTLNADNIPKLKAKVVAGCANNQLEDEETHAKLLKEFKILYAPDYVINAGGLIHVAHELSGYSQSKVELGVSRIAHTLKEIYNESDKSGISTQEAARRYAENRIQSIQSLKQMKTHANSFFSSIK